MRRSAELLKRQDVCFLCAFRIRYGAQHLVPQCRPVRQSRCYQSSTPVAQSASAAVAEKEEDNDDDYPALPSNPIFKFASGRTLLRAPPPTAPTAPPNYELMPDWRCRCGHVNLSNKSQCGICEEPRRHDAQLYYSPKSKSIAKPFRSIFSAERGTMSPSPGQRSPLKASSRFSIFGRDQEERTISISDRPARQRFGAFMDNLPEHQQTSRRQKNVHQPSTPNENSWGKFNTKLSHTDKEVEHRSFELDLSNNYLATGVQHKPRRNRSADFGSIDNTAKGVPATGQFTPFVRKIKPREDLESNKHQDAARDVIPAHETTKKSLTPADKEPAIMPPAESSFDNYEDERRKRRNDRFNQRSQRYQIDDANAHEEQNAKIRDKASKNRRRSQQEIDEEELLLEDEFEERRKKKSRKPKASVVQSKPTLQLPDFISVEQLSRVLKVRVDQFLRKLEEEGFEGARYDHILDAESSAMIADIYGFEVSFGGRQTLDDLTPQPEAEDKSLLPPRPPVVTIMGHVDHGKTTILDWLRNSSVVASEHGGITQHIGAFSVMMPGSDRQITFLDTPGHAAFLDMRRRGAVVTDIVVLVVAADDSVKPQTIEAIKHALEAKVHIIVAINKVDKEDANVARVKQDLANNGIVVEDYGGDYQAIELSGKTGKGMAELEEAILTLADVSDFRAATDGQAEGWILESKVTQAGRVATILVRRGTLRVGDFIVAGTTWARVKTLRNDAGMLVDEALPGTPVQVDGWRGEDPTAGLEVLQAENEEHAKDVVEIRLEKIESQRLAGDLAAMNSTRTEEAEARAKVLAWEAEQTWAKKKRKPADNEGWVEGIASKGAKQVHFVVKADVAGSVEALVAAVSAVGNNEIRANVIHSGTGVLSESDIRHLAATGETAYAISFNQPVDGTISQLARAGGLQILDHNIIYKVTDDVKEKLSAELPPLITQRVLGEAEIGKVFEITTKQGRVKIAGCKINNGSISRSHKVRVLRDGETVYTGKLDSLKNVKKDVTEMRKGTECGMGFSNWEEFEEGDQVQTFEEERSARKLY